MDESEVLSLIAHPSLPEAYRLWIPNIEAQTSDLVYTTAEEVPLKKTGSSQIVKDDKSKSPWWGYHSK